MEQSFSRNHQEVKIRHFLRNATVELSSDREWPISSDAFALDALSGQFRTNLAAFGLRLNICKCFEDFSF